MFQRYQHFLLPTLEPWAAKNRGPLCRRRFLQLAGSLALAVWCPSRATAVVSPLKRRLSFYNTHTDESLCQVYWVDGRLDPQGLARIDHILRDHRTGEVKPIDPRLLNLLYRLGSRFGGQPTYHVISGYRSARTNAMLSQTSTGVARKSLHVQGKAIDIRLPSTHLATLHREARALRGGGVGYYPGPGFIHLDVGRIRYW